MNIGLFTNCFPDKPWEETCRITGEAGITGIEPGAEEIGACLDLGQLFVFGTHPDVCIKVLGKNNAIHNVHAQDTKINKKAIALKGVNDYVNYSELKKKILGI